MVTRRVKTKIMSKKEILVGILAVGAIIISILALISNGLLTTKQASQDGTTPATEVFEQKPASSAFDLSN